MLRPLFNKTKETAKNSYSSSILTYDIVKKDGTPIRAGERCKDYINDTYTSVKDNEIEKDNYFFKNYKMRFKVGDNVPIENFKNSIRFTNHVLSALNIEGKLTLRFVEEEKTRKFRFYIVQFPDKVIFMPPIISLIVECLRNGFYYTDCDWKGYIKNYLEIQDTLKCLGDNRGAENIYLQAVEKSVEKFNKMGGVYQVFDTNPKQMWKIRNNCKHSGNGIQSFVRHAAKKFTED